MHERSIAKNLLKIALEKASQFNQKAKIERIRVVVGEFTMIHDELLINAFYSLAYSTNAEKAIIEIIHSSLQGQCQQCLKTFPINKEAFQCPFCGSAQIDIVSGNELYIKDMDVIDP